jgi:hypothetical protein
MKLENWSVVYDNNVDPYTAPELIRSVLQGNVYGNPKFDDGTFICTSSIVGKNNGDIITKSGSRYELGNVDPAYEALYPNAKRRFFKSLCKVD